MRLFAHWEAQVRLAFLRLISIRLLVTPCNPPPCNLVTPLNAPYAFLSSAQPSPLGSMDSNPDLNHYIAAMYGAKIAAVRKQYERECDHIADLRKVA